MWEGIAAYESNFEHPTKKLGSLQVYVISKDFM